MIELNVKTIYYESDFPILKDIHFTVNKGEIVALTGASGVGKSTILKMIAGIHKGYEGSLNMPNNIRIAFISQNKCLLPWKTVEQNIVLLHKIESGKVDFKRSNELINQLGLSGYEKKYPLFISGGQYQRTALGQAFYYQPDLILMDEPFSALDIKMKREVQDIFIKLQEKFHITTLFVTHNIDEAEYMNSRIIHLEENESREDYWR